MARRAFHRLGQDRGHLDRRVGDRQAPVDAKVRVVTTTRQRDHRVRARLRHRRHAVPGVVGQLATRGVGRLSPAARSVDARRRARPPGNRQRDLRSRRSRRQHRAGVPAIEAAQRHRAARRPWIDRKGRLRDRGDVVPRVVRAGASEEDARPHPDGSPSATRVPALQLPPATSSSSTSCCTASTVSASRSRAGTTRPAPASSSSTSIPRTRSRLVTALCAPSRCCARSPSSKAARSRSWPSPVPSTATGCTCTTRWRAPASRCSTPPMVMNCRS